MDGFDDACWQAVAGFLSPRELAVTLNSSATVNAALSALPPPCACGCSRLLRNKRSDWDRIRQIRHPSDPYLVVDPHYPCGFADRLPSGSVRITCIWRRLTDPNIPCSFTALLFDEGCLERFQAESEWHRSRGRKKKKRWTCPRCWIILNTQPPRRRRPGCDPSAAPDVVGLLDCADPAAPPRP